MKPSRLLLSTLVVLSLAALLSGCGQNTTPTGVTTLDETAPAAPTEITKVASDAFPGGILTWQPSTSAGVAGYDVYQYLPDPTREDAYVLVAQTDASTTQYPLPLYYEVQTLYFRVKAVSGAGVKSGWSETAAIEVGLQVFPDGGTGDAGDDATLPDPVKP